MTLSSFDISGKACLVVGGTSGLGQAVTLGLVQAGARVVAGSSNPAKVAAMKTQLGRDHDAITVDVTSPESAAAAVAHTVKTLGRIDALINAAGVIKKQPSLDLSPADFEAIVRVNLVGAFIVAQAAGRAMKSQSPDAKGQRGNIITFASLNSYVSFSEVLAYACGKAGVMALTRGLANEWAQYGIRVNGIAPGVFPTDLNRPLIAGTPRGQWLKDHTPMGRFGQAEEIVGAAVYLLSDAASFVTGETLVVDGGFLAKAV
ncbi:MAG: SDR family oxidoreductase [Phycisphaerae bacterium]|nr:SDR family oxidoreductase [Phycisphaerae bacterium]